MVVAYLAGSTSCSPCRDRSRQTSRIVTCLAIRSTASRSVSRRVLQVPCIAGAAIDVLRGVDRVMRKLQVE
jgi:hypothetical protein